MFISRSEEEILEGMKDEHVTEISRILKGGPTKIYEMGPMSKKGLTNTGKFTVTFEAPTTPQKIKIPATATPTTTTGSNLQINKTKNGYRSKTRTN